MEFVTLYEPVVYRLLRRHGLQDVDARDVMQELFLAVSRGIQRWDPDKERGSFRGWLRRVVRNLVVNWLKSRQRRDVAGGSDLHALLERLPAADSQETVEFDRELRRARFQRAAQRVQGEVHESSWQAFLETSVIGMSAVDAAIKLGMTPGAVRVANCRVLARLRTAVAEPEEQK